MGGRDAIAMKRFGNAALNQTKNRLLSCCVVLFYKTKKRRRVGSPRGIESWWKQGSWKHTHHHHISRPRQYHVDRNHHRNILNTKQSSNEGIDDCCVCAASHDDGDDDCWQTIKNIGNNSYSLELFFFFFLMLLRFTWQQNICLQNVFNSNRVPIHFVPQVHKNEIPGTNRWPK